MEDIKITINKLFPLFDIPTSISKTDEYNGNEIKYLQRYAFEDGYNLCKQQHDWIDANDSLPEQHEQLHYTDFKTKDVITKRVYSDNGEIVHEINQRFRPSKNIGFLWSYGEREISTITHWKFI